VNLGLQASSHPTTAVSANGQSRQLEVGAAFLLEISAKKKKFTVRAERRVGCFQQPLAKT
jgi:hypothetical protein